MESAETPTPGGETPTPGEETLTPGEETPGEETLTPGEETPTPGEETPTPGEETPTPGEETLTPGEETPETPTPGEETPTPGEETPTPGEETPETPTPGEETPETPTPGEETPTPGEETPETPTPGEETPETPTPGEETPTPGEETPETPTPGEETPAGEDPAVLDWKLPQDKKDGGDGGQEGKWQMGDLEQNLPPPIIYHEILWRDWQDLGDPLTEKQFDFTVLSYNILSQDLIEQNPHLYQHCPSPILQWGYRWPNLLQELQHWEADILCLQEVQENHYREEIRPALSTLGYSCHYKRRTGRKTDGCATFFRTRRFSLLQESHVEFFRPAIDVLNRDNVGLVLMLRPVLPEEEEGLSPPSLCVANTHLLYNPRRGDIKLAQLALLLAEVDKLSRSPEGPHCPIILCGDLNTTPNSPLYQLLHNGVLNCHGLPAWKVSGQEPFCGVPQPRTLPFPLWPDILGVNDHCQYTRPPKVKDRRMYSRQRLLELRHCDSALQRPQNLIVIKGVTDNQPDPEAATVQAGIFPVLPESLLRTPHLLQHHLQLTSAYTHFLSAKDRYEVTTFPLGIGSTVDYIFYSAEPVPICTTNKGLRIFQDGHLKLLGRLCLLSEDDLWAGQGLPNPFCCSDHLCLLTRFGLNLSAP